MHKGRDCCCGMPNDVIFVLTSVASMWFSLQGSCPEPYCFERDL